MVCESFNGNGFWVLDAGTLRLLKVNDKFEVVTTIENLSFLTNSKTHPTQMFEYNDQLFLVTPNQQVMVFDAFGALIKKWEINNDFIGVFQNNMITYVSPNFVISKLKFDPEVLHLKWVLNEVKSFKAVQQKIYVLTASGFYIGHFNLISPTNNK